MPFVTRVVIAEDHPAVRENIRAGLLASNWVDSLPSDNLRIKIVGEASTGRDGVRLALDEHPDIVLLDLHLPDMDGLAAAARIFDTLPSAAVVMHSFSYSAPYVLKALAAGARGFVAKGDGIDHVLQAFRSLRSGHSYLSPSVAAEMELTTASLFGSEGIRELLDVFDREAFALWNGLVAVTADPSLAHEALLQSFLAYAIARLGPEPIPHPRTWLLLSVVSSLYTPIARNSTRPPVSALQRALNYGHANPADFTRYFQDTLSPRSKLRLSSHLRSCPACHLEWCLAGFAGNTVSADPLAIQLVRSQLAADMRRADLGLSANAWSKRGRAIRRFVASDLDVLLGLTAATGWQTLENSTGPGVSTPAVWTGELLGSRARRSSSALDTAMQSTPGLAK